ncbi:hypothetical protein K437DRAFT_273217 [Tilletiaria anomala UBC 951]|uniref:Uncharacterized protein n=1 Tax=Tilletiaria anomala (strain ATCC 24038 / CBS 436.72 / UBC 951) TaxID=1037660 RepID=A0A066WAI3_TILAU|nr:uncharacterized protein K437DRAFT_273217 [Tilletiaria anomala UBC 951]KDN49563.1 hypothetical protein K437DRAFT_273217 [Tilletiaria anomala UBC 951]
MDEELGIGMAMGSPSKDGVEFEAAARGRAAAMQDTRTAFKQASPNANPHAATIMTPSTRSSDYPNKRERDGEGERNERHMISPTMSVPKSVSSDSDSTIFDLASSSRPRTSPRARPGTSSGSGCGSGAAIGSPSAQNMVGRVLDYGLGTSPTSASHMFHAAPSASAPSPNSEGGAGRTSVVVADNRTSPAPSTPGSATAPEGISNYAWPAHMRKTAAMVQAPTEEAPEPQGSFTTMQSPEKLATIASYRPTTAPSLTSIGEIFILEPRTVAGTGSRSAAAAEQPWHPIQQEQPVLHPSIIPHASVLSHSHSSSQRGSFSSSNTQHTSSSKDGFSMTGPNSALAAAAAAATKGLDRDSGRRNSGSGSAIGSASETAAGSRAASSAGAGGAAGAGSVSAVKSGSASATAFGSRAPSAIDAAQPSMAPKTTKTITAAAGVAAPNSQAASARAWPPTISDAAEGRSTSRDGNPTTLMQPSSHPATIALSAASNGSIMPNASAGTAPTEARPPSSGEYGKPPSYFSGHGSSSAASGRSSSQSTDATSSGACAGAALSLGGGGANASAAVAPQPPVALEGRCQYTLRSDKPIPPGTAPSMIHGNAAGSSAGLAATNGGLTPMPALTSRVRPSTTTGAISIPSQSSNATAASSPQMQPQPILSPLQLRDLHQLEEERLLRMSQPRLSDQHLALDQDLQQQADRVRAASVATGGPIPFYTARQHQSYLEGVRGEIARDIFPIDPAAAAEYLVSGILPGPERGVDVAAAAAAAAAAAFGLGPSPLLPPVYEVAAQNSTAEPPTAPVRTTSLLHQVSASANAGASSRVDVQHPAAGLEYGKIITGQEGEQEPEDWDSDAEQASEVVAAAASEVGEKLATLAMDAGSIGQSSPSSAGLYLNLEKAGEATMRDLELQRHQRQLAEPLPPLSELMHVRDDPASPPSAQRSAFHSPSQSTMSARGSGMGIHPPPSLYSSSSSTALDEHGRGSPRVPVPRPRLQSKVYGLSSDLRERVQRGVPVQGEFIERGDWRNEEISIKTFTPNFSVELAAKSFDMLDRAVFIGRAPLIRGVVRIPAYSGKWLAVRLSAHCSSPSPNIEGSLGPTKPVKHGEREIFETVDIYDPRKFQTKPKLAPHDPRTGIRDPTWAPQDKRNDYFVEIPFDINLPVGVSSVYKDGKIVHQPTPLPPSYEATDDTFTEQPWKGEVRDRSTTAAVKEALAKGFTKSTRLGVWYNICFDLFDGSAPKDNQVPKLSKSKEKKRDKGDSMKIPFIFLGEPGNLRSGPQMLPPIISPKFLLEPGSKLCAGWACHTGRTRWAKGNWSMFKRDLKVELHLPKPAYFDIPSVIPFLLVLRPEESQQLPSMDDEEVREILSGSSMNFSHLFGESIGDLHVLAERGEDASIDQQLSMQDLNNKAAALMEKYESSFTPKKVGSWMKNKLGKGREKEQANAAVSSDTMLLSEKSGARSDADVDKAGVAEKGLPALSEKARLSPSSSYRTFKRPGTMETSQTSSAATVASMAYSQAPSAITVTTVHDICSYIKVTLVQLLHAEEGNVNSAPTVRRRVLAHADLEEVDVGTMFMREEDLNNPNPRPLHPKVQEAISMAKKEGWRVVQGMIRIGSEHSPGFKCQGIAVRHALKVDLLPFTKVLRKAVKETAQLTDISDTSSQGSFGTLKHTNGSGEKMSASKSGASLDLSLSPAFNSSSLFGSRPSTARKTPPSPQAGRFGTYGPVIVRHGPSWRSQTRSAGSVSSGKGANNGVHTGNEETSTSSAKNDEAAFQYEPDVEEVKLESEPQGARAKKFGEEVDLINRKVSYQERLYQKKPQQQQQQRPGTGRMLPPRTPASLAAPRMRLGTATSSASGLSSWSSANRSDISGTWSTFTMDPLSMNKEFSLHKTYGVVWVDVRLQRGKVNQNVYGAEI